MTTILRELKWIAYCIKLVLLFLAGVLGSCVRREKDSVVLTGETNHTGGTFAYFRALIDMLLAEGFRVRIVVHRSSCERQMVEMALKKGIRVSVVPPTFDILAHLVFWFRVLQARASLIISSAGGPGLYTMSLLSGVPTVHVFHSAPEGGLDRRKRRLLRWFFGPRHRMVAVSKSARASILKHFRIPDASRGRVHFIYNGVPDSLHLRKDRVPEEDVVVTIGHVISYKNPSTWIQTARYVTERARRPVSFLWIGDGPDLALYSALTKDSPQIRFAGFRSDAAVLLARARIYYQPSLVESFGLAVAEALSMGIPCVVSNRGGLPEVVADGFSGFVCPSSSVECHGDAILRLLNDSALYARMSGKARQEYCEKFTLERWHKDLMAVIRKAGN